MPHTLPAVVRTDGQGSSSVFGYFDVQVQSCGEWCMTAIQREKQDMTDSIERLRTGLDGLATWNGIFGELRYWA